MLIQGTYPSGGVAAGVIPVPQLLIGSAQAWTLILLLLALCCGLLWLLTTPARSAAQRTCTAASIDSFRTETRRREYTEREAAWSPR